MPVIHLVPTDTEWEVWLDTEDSYQDGTIVGVGPMAYEALQDAIATLSNLAYECRRQIEHQDP